ncbi:MAG: preprotein translocase subunit YajC [Deltaproteobacteria bacterium]|nr:preprotein translocase subunit YajC [Deltaproteobacteria bacterium]
MSQFVSMAPIAVLFIVFYFLLIRPQQKKAKEQKEMISNLQKGDNIISSSGIFGRITSVNEDSVTVEIAENVRVKMVKDAVASRKPQG